MQAMLLGSDLVFRFVLVACFVRLLARKVMALADLVPCNSPLAMYG
jgi:hypothetical protein